MPITLTSGSNNRRSKKTPSEPHKLSKIIVHREGKSVVYVIWDYKSTNNPSSIPHMVRQCCKDLEKSGYAIDVIVFGSRKWAEFVALSSPPYHLVYDAAQDRGIIYFVEKGCDRGRLKIENLPDEEVAPQP